MNPNLQSVAASWGVAADQIPLIIDLIRESPLLQSAVVRPSTHGGEHRYREIEKLPAATFRDVGQGIVPQRIDNNMIKIDLKELSYALYDDYRVIREWRDGKEGWLKDNYHAAYEGMVQSASKALIYGNLAEGKPGSFKGLVQYAQDTGNIVAEKGADSGERTSIIAVRWNELNGASLRINKSPLIDIEDQTPGAPMPKVVDPTTGAEMMVYQWMFGMFWALAIPSKSSVAAITQIDSSKNVSVADMNALVNRIRKGSGERYIYTSETGYERIAALKNAKLSMFMENTEYSDIVATWRGVPIIIDDNIVETETF